MLKFVGILISIVLLSAGRAPASVTVALNPAGAPPSAAQAREVAAIDSALGNDQYGRLCVDWPDTFPTTVYNFELDEEGQARMKTLLAMGFIRASGSQTDGDGVKSTRYDITPDGQRYFGSYRELGSISDSHGFCYAEYRVGRIISGDPNKLCAEQLIAPPDRTVTRLCRQIVVKYLPRVVSQQAWIDTPEAKHLPGVPDMGTFAQKPLTVTLVRKGQTWIVAPFAIIP
jgi:hypothetical protein